MAWVAFTLIGFERTPSWFLSRTRSPVRSPARSATSAFTQTSFSSIAWARTGFVWVRLKVWTGERPKSRRKAPGGPASGRLNFGTGSKPASLSWTE